MGRWKRAAIFSFGLALVISSGAADDRSTLAKNLELSLGLRGYGATEIIYAGRHKQFVKAQVNGEDVLLTLTTGYKSALTNDSARALKLDIHVSDRLYFWLGGAFKEKPGVALLNNFTINSYAINRTNLIDVLPKSSALAFDGGMLGYDFLHLNAALLAMDWGFLFFKPGNAPPASIAHAMGALGYQAVPMSLDEDGLKICCQIDGHPVTARVDSGLLLSTFDLAYVTTANETIYPAYADMVTEDGRVPIRYICPTKFSLGSFALAARRVPACTSTFFAHYGCNLVLGADLLTSHHAVIDFGSNILWLR
jgi:hypothetical protein